MKLLKNPVIAVLLTVLIVLSSTIITTSVKLNNKCNAVIDEFYEGRLKQGIIYTSIYADICSMYELGSEVALVADNYGVKTKDLVNSINELKNELSYRNTDISDIYADFNWFYSSLRAVEIELSNIGLSQRHIEYMSAVSQQIAQLKYSIDNSSYNESVRTFYKKFDRFPVNIFAELFDIDYPEYFA